LTKFSFSQENSGIVHSNYAPTNSVLINPSSIGDSKVYWEINLIGASAFIDNNYVYSPNFSILSALRSSEPLDEPIDNFKPGNKSAYVDVALHGPSFYLNLGKHAIGLTTQLRTVVDGRNIDANLSKFMYEGFKYFPQRGIEYSTANTKINTMTWGELGINYAYTFKQKSNNMYIGGISIKRLYGFSHLGINIKDATYTVPDTTNVQFSNIDAKYGFSSPSFNAGRGWGIDIGFTYKKTLEEVDAYIPYSKKSGCKKPDYLYKLGISLLDLGYISFNGDSYYGEIKESGTWGNYSNSNLDDNYNLYDAKILESFNSSTNVKNSYSAYLPTALSIQYDYNFQNGFYLNGTVVQNLSFFNQLGVNRQNLLAVTPRFELPRFEVALPLSLRRYTSPSFGLAFRFWNNLIIGSDRLGSLLFKGDTYGTDIYFNIKIAKLYTNKCRVKKSNRKFKNYRTNSCHFTPNRKWKKKKR
tara:strand:- start:6804 stop:8213 length:1410 start_codon:yes stop_codon:yes gene_type:complete